MSLTFLGWPSLSPIFSTALFQLHDRPTPTVAVGTSHHRLRRSPATTVAIGALATTVASHPTPDSLFASAALARNFVAN